MHTALLLRLDLESTINMLREVYQFKGYSPSVGHYTIDYASWLGRTQPSTVLEHFLVLADGFEKLLACLSDFTNTKDQLLDLECQEYVKHLRVRGSTHQAMSRLCVS